MRTRLPAWKLQYSGGAPRIAFDYPFAETPDLWIPIGLSDPEWGRRVHAIVQRHPAGLQQHLPQISPL